MSESMNPGSPIEQREVYIGELREKNQQLHNRIAELTAQVQALTKERDVLRQTISLQVAKTSTARRENESLRAENERLKKTQTP